MLELIYYILIIIFIIFIFLNYTNIIKENFDISFGTPPETSDIDKGHMKSLLEIGSQSDEDKKYDIVSTNILGKINRVNPNIEEIEPEEPNCFNNDYDFDYNGLKNFDREKINSCNSIKSCCDRPTKHEIDMDFNLLNETLDLTLGFNMDDHLNLDLPSCCND